jgi:hypothetical protein
MLPVPDLFEMQSDVPGDYAARFHDYLDQLYEIYKHEVAFGKLKFHGMDVRCQFRPEAHGKHYAFWHMMQEGTSGEATEDERIIDFDRCQRIRWIAWCITHAGCNDPRVRVFQQNKRNGHQPWALWLYENDYVVILWERNGYYLLKTAFCVKYLGKRKEFERNWQAYKKRQGTP